ncbi:MAG: InlB B-repeat-containing protein [Clostridia bacterium]|nr:InlB B-repeat-containing protein [Clostridia bacterium]
MKNGTHIVSRIISAALAVLFFAVTFGAFGTVAVAAETEEYVLDTLTKDDPISPIPLLCIRVSFDANGNGEDDYDPYNPTKLYSDKEADYYGEQWIHSSASYWQKMLFAEGNKSLYDFYSEMTDGKFYYYAGEENEGVVNDGIVDVAIHLAHPRSKLTSGTADGGERRAALIAANEYVDFSKYDKNGNGYVDYYELAIVFVLAGYEAAYNSSRPSSAIAFGTHAHYTGGGGVILDDVVVTQSGHQGYVKCGEYMNSSNPITVGTVAHELGHFIGAADLYDTGNGNWSGYVSNMSLMASGSHNNNAGSPRGAEPSYMDPFHMIYVGITTSETVRDGEYTLYSRESTVGDYNIIRINTENPNEYYLVENRYATSTYGSGFDSSQSGGQGIVIWHIDDEIVNRGKVNNANSGHDPGVVIMGRTSITSTYCAFARRENLDESYYTFIAANTKYKFPVSKTWNTSLESGAEFGLKIEVLDPGGPEMRIVVSGTIDCPPTVDFDSGKKVNADYESLTLRGKIYDLCGGNVTSCGFIVSKDADPTPENGIVVYAVPNADGTFTATVDNLESGTRYYCKVFAGGSQGTGSKTIATYTKYKSTGSTEREYYTVYLYSNYNNLARKFAIQVYPGNKITYQIKYTWAGYTFCGWYVDATLTQRFDMNYVQDTKEDFSLYGKWVEEERAMTLNVVGAKTVYNFAAEIGTTYGEPIPEERSGYIFGGWYVDETLTEPFDFDTPVTEEEITVYAKWISENENDETTETTTEATTEATTETTTESTTETTTEAITEATTETTTEATTETATEASTEERTQKPEGGCGSVILTSLAVMITATLGCAVITKKGKH